MQILITGGAGFIGGHLAESLVRQGHSVTILDNFDPFYDIELKFKNVECARQAAVECDGSHKVVEGDIRDRDVVESVVSDADVVYHEAAQAGVRTSLDNPGKVTDVNISGTLNVLEAAKNSDVERVVMASSSSVYGQIPHLPFEESHPNKPVSPYGASKLAAEHYGRIFHEIYGLPVVSLRYFTVYGPRMRPNMAISNFVSRCVNGKAPVIYGDGMQTRDFTYVPDIVRTNRKLLTSDAADGSVLNVGSSERIAIVELAELVRDRLAPELDIRFVDEVDADAKHTHADISRAREIIGYEPSTSIREGVNEFIDWYLDNRSWYEPLVNGS